MAINAISQDSKVKIQLDGGLDEKGNTIVKSKTYSKVKATAINDDVYSVAASVAGLQEFPLLAVRRIDEVDLSQGL